MKVDKLKERAKKISILRKRIFLRKRNLQKMDTIQVNLWEDSKYNKITYKFFKFFTLRSTKRIVIKN